MLPAERLRPLAEVRQMAINKVNYGDRTLIDLTQDTVTPEMLLAGETAHDKTGEQIRGTHVPFSGQYNDLKGKPETFPPASHSQSASIIQAGTFVGQVVANANGQNPAAYCMRNSKLSNNGETPTVNGQVIIGYDGKPSSVMVGGTVYPITSGGGHVTQLFNDSVYKSDTIKLTKPLSDFDIIIFNWVVSARQKGIFTQSQVIPTGSEWTAIQLSLDIEGVQYEMTLDLSDYDISVRYASGYADRLRIIGVKI